MEKKSIDIVKKFYDDNVEMEWERLNKHKIEWDINTHYLDKYIKSGDTVLEIGGGPGRYSLYLAEKGCDVFLTDLSDGNVEFGINKAKEMGLDIEACQLDAMDTSILGDRKFDHILIMGPMYHLLDEKDRDKVIENGIKHLNPNGKIYIAFISNNSGILDLMKNAPELIGELPEDAMESFINGRDWSGIGFTRAFFIQPKNVEKYMEKFPFEKLHILGCESIFAPNEKNIMAQDEKIYNKWIDLGIKVCEREEFLSMSEHIMYIGMLN